MCYYFSVYKNSGYIDTVAAVAMRSMEKAVTEANEKSGDSEVQCVHIHVH